MPGRTTFADLPMGSTNAEKGQLSEAEAPAAIPPAPSR